MTAALEGGEWPAARPGRPHFTPGKDSVLILQEVGWAQGPVWTGGKSRPDRVSIPDRPAPSQSLLSYPATSQKLPTVFKLKTEKRRQHKEVVVHISTIVSEKHAALVFRIFSLKTKPASSFKTLVNFY